MLGRARIATPSNKSIVVYWLAAEIAHIPLETPSKGVLITCLQGRVEYGLW